MDWIRSSRCDTNACVEVNFDTPGLVLVCHSNARGGKILAFTAEEWRVFIQGAKDGEFDV